MKLLANSSYGYEIVDRCHHSITEYTKVENTRAAIKNKIFKRLGHIYDQLYEIELAKSEIERKESLSVGFFILRYVELRVLELYYVFLQTFSLLASMRKWIPIHCN